MPTADEDFLRGFYRNLSDGPLEPDHPWYVPIYTEATASSADPVQRLARGIQWNPIESAQLFSGFRGTGKSTELRRLRRMLEQQGFVVVLCDMKRYLNLSTPVDISDFLISAAGAVSDALAEDSSLLGKDLAERGYWRRAVEFLTRTEVEINAIPTGADISDASTTLQIGLKDDPSFREQLQQRMRGHLGALADDVRAFMADCVKALRKKHGPDTNVVILFDSIEQIRGSSINDAQVFASVESLFVGHPDKLRFQSTHVVYTVPPWLKIRSPRVTKLYDGGYTVPCVKIRDRDGAPSQPGLGVLRRIVAQRGDWTRLIANEADFDHVLMQTGGYLRDLFRALQGMLMNAAEHQGRALDRAAVEYELAELRNDYLPVAIEDAKWLAQVAKSHEAELPQHGQIPYLSRYFDTHLLLCYRNGNEWYDLHPLIRDVVERLAARAAAGADE
ncbi:MAG: hypothetical protein R6X02_34220 [Enhygromyxa sp.]